MGKRAEKYLDKLSEESKLRITSKLLELENDPFRFLKPLFGVSFYKLRVGDYRLLVDFDNKAKILKVQYINHRSKIYKRFRKKLN